MHAEDPKASDVLYIKALAAAFTVNTIPDAALNARLIAGRDHVDERRARHLG
jgi:transaldolase